MTEEPIEKEEETTLVIISVKGENYDIHFNPFVPDKILIDALETGVNALKEGKAEVKVDVNVEIGRRKQRGKEEYEQAGHV